MEDACPVDYGATARPASLRLVLVECFVIFALFALFAGQAPPAVNEAHYLAKARHAWNPDWCQRDLFLASADAHSAFVWLFGWVTTLVSFPVATWIGRSLVWACLAAGWQRMSYAAVARPGLSVLTASLFLMWTDSATMAGEWVIGGVEAKGFAYALVWWGLSELLRSRWNRGLACFGAAAAFHVLVGGWSVVAAGMAWLSCGAYRPPLKSLAPGLVAAGVLSLWGLIPALRLTMGNDPEVVAQANWIYVYGRLSHHLVFHRFAHVEMARHALLLALWLGIGFLTPCGMAPGRLGQRPLRGFVGGAVTLTVVGIAIDQSLLDHPQLAATLLKYYWFRLGDAMLPVAAAIAVGGATVRWWTSRPRAARVLVAVCGLLATIQIVASSREHGLFAGASVDPPLEQLTRLGRITADEQTRVAADWDRTCRWIAANTPPDALFITPRNQQTFKWRAERAEVVAIKDFPQDATSVLEWQRRREILYPPYTGWDGLLALGERRLGQIAAEFDASYIVIDRYLARREPRLRRVFPSGDEPCAFGVYEAPTRESREPLLP